MNKERKAIENLRGQLKRVEDKIDAEYQPRHRSKKFMRDIIGRRGHEVYGDRADPTSPITGLGPNNMPTGVTGNKLLPPAVAAYCETLEDPFHVRGIKCPYSINNLKPNGSMTGITPYAIDFTVAAGYTREFGLFPGHTSGSDVSGEDLTAAHSKLQRIGNVTPVGTNYVVGPFEMDSYSYTVGYYQDINSTAYAATKTDVDNTVRIDSREPLPFVGTEGNPYHTRWRVVSMGIIIRNTTPWSTRGGTVRSVQPDYPYASAYQTDFEVFDSFCDWGVDPQSGGCNCATEHSRCVCNYNAITWIPRPEDISFWHPADVATPEIEDGTEQAGLRAWLVNNTGSAQSYSVYVLVNWEFAGSKYQALVTDTVDHPIAGTGAFADIGNVLRRAGAAAKHVGAAAVSLLAGSDAGFNEVVHKVLGYGATVVKGMMTRGAFDLNKIGNALLPRVEQQALRSVLGIGAAI